MRERERERESERERDRQRKRERDRERQRERGDRGERQGFISKQQREIQAGTIYKELMAFL